ncbi:MAG: DMT family transporter [Nanobdellota archaeon]
MNGYLLLLLGMIIASSSGVFIKIIDLPATSIAFFRFIVPLVISFIVIRYKGIKLFTGRYRTMLLASFLNALRLIFYFVAYIYTTMTNSIIMLFTWPIFAAIFGVYILKENITRKQIMLFALAFIGIIVMNLGKELSFDNRDFIGMGAMLISAVVLSLTNISYKKVISTFSNWETIFYQNLFGAFIFLPFIIFNSPGPTNEQISLGLLYSFLIGIVAFYIFFSAMRKLKMIEYSLLKYMEVVFNILFGFLIFGDKITLQVVIGGGLIIFSGMLLRMKIVERKNKAKPQPK